ncbi:AI-2E family transporter [Geminocystis herdmanii]|uniref:AI-2E family transporter n=1 Tax=Geminocystis herdmanii TaxID=669359 RepID=UPI0003458665|nr:AI-2E family transporter [Geminocystis herdmanii]
MDFGKWVSFSLVIIFIYILWQIKQILLLVFTAVVAALILNIIVKKLVDFGLKRGYAVLSSILLLFCVITFFILIIIPSFLEQFQELYNLVPLGIQKLILEVDQFKYNLSSEWANSLPDLEQILLDLQPLLNDLLKRGFIVITGVFGALLSGLLLLALTLMILVDPIPYKDGFIRLFPYFYRSRINDILLRIKIELEEWLADTFIKVISVFILTFLTLLIFNVPLVSAQAFLAACLAFIPYIGSITSVVSPMAISFLYSDWKSWAILIVYLGIYHSIDKIIIPKLRRNRVILIPANVIIGQIIFANFLGVLGLFLAFPLIIITQILIKEILIKDIFDSWKLTEEIKTLNNEELEIINEELKVINEE